MSRGDDFAVEAAQRVQLDVEQGFAGVLSARDDAAFAVGLHDSDLDAERALATSDDLVVVPWRYPCTHVGTFMNIPATLADFELRGTTFVDIRDGKDWTYYRYIDFVGALHQIGVSTNGRPVIAEPDS
jgi:hypothetical protein